MDDPIYNTYKVTSQLANPAVLLTDVKDYLRITDNNSDALLTRLISVATLAAEKYTRRDFITRTYETFRDRFPSYPYPYPYTTRQTVLDSDRGAIVLRRSPLQSVTSVEYYKDDVLTLWDSADYIVTDESDYSSIHSKQGVCFPSNIDIRPQAVKITFVAGYGDTEADIPMDIKQALILMVSDAYENRGDCDISTVGGSCGCASHNSFVGLLNQYRIIEI